MLKTACFESTSAPYEKVHACLSSEAVPVGNAMMKSSKQACMTGFRAARSSFSRLPAIAGSKYLCHDAVPKAAVNAGEGGGPYVSLAGVPGSSSMAAVRPPPSCWSITSTMSETVMASSASWRSGPCCHANPPPHLICPVRCQPLDVISPSTIRACSHVCKLACT